MICSELELNIEQQCQAKNGRLLIYLLKRILSLPGLFHGIAFFAVMKQQTKKKEEEDERISGSRANSLFTYYYDGFLHRFWSLEKNDETGVNRIIWNESKIPHQ